MLIKEVGNQPHRIFFVRKNIAIFKSQTNIFYGIIFKDDGDSVYEVSFDVFGYIPLIITTKLLDFLINIYKSKSHGLQQKIRDYIDKTYSTDDESLPKKQETNQFRVFSTIKDVIIKWLKANNPEALYFIAPDDKRSAIYFNLFKQKKEFMIKLGYSVHQTDQGLIAIKKNLSKKRRNEILLSFFENQSKIKTKLQSFKKTKAI